MTNSKKGKGKKGTPKAPRLPASRLQRVVQKLGLAEIFPNLSKMSDGDLQTALARFLHYGECHTELGINSENFKLTSLPSVAFSEVKKAPLRSPLIEPYFHTLTLHEIACLSLDGHNVTLDEPPMDSDDFLGCRFFFRFVAEALEHGSRLVIMQDEKQSLAVLVHVKALRKLNGDPETALLQVEYNCIAKADVHVTDSTAFVSQFLSKTSCSSIVGTVHQIHFVMQVLEAHERLLDKSVISEHDREWHPRQNLIRPSFIVSLKPLPSNSEHRIMQEIKGLVTPAPEGSSSDPVASAAAPSNENSPSPAGASVLMNPWRDMGGHTLTLINHRDTPDISKIKEAKVNHMPNHKEGEIYVIKAQAGPLDCLVYDRERSFTTMVNDAQEQAALRGAIRAANHRAGAKAYLYAENEGDRVRVYLEDRPEQYVNW